jgi:hypothetical protein
MFSDIKTKKQQEIAIALLENAKKRIKEDRNPAVCGALLSSVYELVGARGVRHCQYMHVYDEIKEEIANRIGGPFEYVTDWLEKQGIKQIGSKNARIYRQLWIKDMIREIKGKK